MKVGESKGGDTSWKREGDNTIKLFLMNKENKN